MSTNSSVTVKQGDTFKVIYCHWDGYPSNNGKLLLDHYNSQEGADSLVNLGNLSSLQKSVDCPEGHSFGSPMDDCTIFYGRDRGDEDQEAREYNESEGVPDDELQEYNYFWNGEKWLINGYEHKSVELTEELCKE